MSTFKVPVVKVFIEEHPNADALEIAKVGDYLSIVRKGQFQTGDLAVYIPEDSIVPDAVLEPIGLLGKLSGNRKDRVRPVRLRGVFSQGILMKPEPAWAEGDDVAEILGITKYEPPVPGMFTGGSNVGVHVGQENTIHYDIENFKAYPDLISPGEDVVMTEKIHGTCCVAMLYPELVATEEGEFDFFVASKGIGSKGWAYSMSEQNAQVIYVRAMNQYAVREKMLEVFGESRKEPVFLVGEVFGIGVQDLGYNHHEIGFRVFDIAMGRRHALRYLGDEDLEATLTALGLARAPVLYRGPFSKEVMYEHTNGLETLSGKQVHVREGVVVRPRVERQDRKLGRVQLKSVSQDYLLRKNATEYT